MKRFRFLMPLGFLAILAVFGATVMLLWNWLMPVIFGLANITFWQALGLLVLCRMLIGGFHVGGGFRNQWGGRQGTFKTHWHEMSEQERREFMERWSNRKFGPFSAKGSNTTSDEE